MQILTPMEKSQSTLYTSTSTKSMVSDDVDSDSDMSLNECDMTLVADDDYILDPKNEAEIMFYQVVEMLRFEEEVFFEISSFF